MLEYFQLIKSEGALFLKDLIFAKSLKGKIPLKKEFDPLIIKGLLKSEGETVELILNNDGCFLISTLLLESETHSFKSATLQDALNLVKKVINKATHLGIVQGTSQFKKYLLKGIIINSFDPKNKLYDEILNCQFDERFHEVSDSVCLALEELSLPIEKAFTIYLYCYNKADGASQEVFFSLRRYAANLGNEMLSIAVESDCKNSAFMTNILTGYYKNSPEAVWKWMEKLRTIGLENTALSALRYFEFASEAEMSIALAYLGNCEISESNRAISAEAYAAILDSPLCSPLIREECLNKIDQFTQAKDIATDMTIVRRLINMGIADEIKCALLEKIGYQNEHIQRMAAMIIKNFHPTLFFRVVRSIAKAAALEFKPEFLQPAFEHNYTTFPVDFSRQLLKVLTDRKGLTRYSGAKILQLLDHKDKPFVFQIDLLECSDWEQIRLVDSVMFDIIHVDKVIRQLLSLKASTHEIVIRALANNLQFIIEDHLGEAMDSLREHLKKDDPNDAAILAIWETYYSDLIYALEKKRSIDEFKPYKNQNKLFDKFWKLTKHRMQESMTASKSSDHNSILSMMSTVHIARGKLWKMPGRSPQPLQHISSSFTMPRTYFMNPDRYNLEIKQRISTNYLE